MLKNNLFKYFLLIIFIGALAACKDQDTKESSGIDSNLLRAGYEIVDCKLPGTIRGIGRHHTSMAPGRIIKTSVDDCGIKGGEYIAYDRSDYATALSTWLPQAERGDEEAQTYVGEIFEKGLTGTPNYEMASIWYGKAAENGYVPAMLSLGRLYENGLGVDKDLIKAINLYRNASGLENNDIAFASAFEESKKRNEKRIQELKIDLRYEKSNVIELKRQLDRARTEKSTKARDLQMLHQKITEQQQTYDDYKKLSEPGYIGQMEKRKHELEKQVDVANKQLLDQHNEISQLQGEIADLKKTSILPKDNKIDELSDELITLRTALNTKNREIELLESEAIIALQKLAQEDNQNSKANQLAINEAQEKLEQEVYEKEKLRNELKSKEKEIVQLKADLESGENTYKVVTSDQDEKLEELQLLLVEKERFFNEQKIETRKKSENLQDVDAEVVRLRKELESRPTTEQLLAMEQQLRGTKLKYEEVKKSESALSAELDGLQAKLEEVAPDIAPSIAISFPKDLKKNQDGTYSVTVAAGSQLHIVGSVYPAVELKKLIFNGKSMEIDKHGLFMEPIDISVEPTDVVIVAEDNMGRSTKYSLKVQPSNDEQVVFSGAGQLYSEKVNFGNYHALIIGNNKYTPGSGWNTLDNAENDAIAIERILKTKYGFKTKLLLNATRVDILSTLSDYKKTLNKHDNLLVFYSGHGTIDEAEEGYWIPVDAHFDRRYHNWISTSDVNNMIRTMTVSNLLIVADSCYSGAWTRSGYNGLRSGLTPEERRHYLKNDIQAITRVVLTSGGLQPVADGGGGKHSVFTSALLDVLKDNQSLLDVEALSREVGVKVSSVSRKATKQTPRYASLHKGGHEGGHFYLVPKGFQLH